MFCQLFSLQNKSFLCLQHVENKGFQTVIKHRLKAIQKPIKNELGNRKKNTKNAHFVLKKCTFRFRDYRLSTKNTFVIHLAKTSMSKACRAYRKKLPSDKNLFTRMTPRSNKYAVSTTAENMPKMMPILWI